MMFLMGEAPVLTNLIGKFIQVLFDAIGNFGWAIVVFAVILKVILMPLDIWPKVSTRKTSKKMAIIQPQLAKIQKQYANNKDELSRKQMELYKKENLSVFGMAFSSCLPIIVTLVVFIVVFNGVQSIVRYQNELVLYNLNTLYESLVSSGASADVINVALAEKYSTLMHSWLWVDNVFMADTWVKTVPSMEAYLGTGLGKIGAKIPLGVNATYNTLVGPALQQAQSWNGYLVLPVLSTVLSIVSQLIMKNQTPAAANPQASANGAMKIMMYILPVMIGVFTLFYSTILSIYFLVNSIVSLFSSVMFSFITTRTDKRLEENRLTSTFIRKK